MYQDTLFSDNPQNRPAAPVGPVLSICIPTYNRANCLRQQFLRLAMINPAIRGQIEVLISDNCSTDQTRAVVADFENKLAFRYMCQEQNLGPDGNFLSCTRQATGRYIWLLGDDDFLKPDYLEELLEQLNNHSFGLVHLGTPKRKGRMEVYTDVDDYVCKLGEWITFMSGNIFRRDALLPLEHYEKYLGTNLLQVAMYLDAALHSDHNALLHRRFYDAATAGATNGGYNIMRVFVQNFSQILEDYEEQGLPPHAVLVVRNKVSDFIFPYVLNFMILKKSSNFDTSGARKILADHLGMQRVWLSGFKFFFRPRNLWAFFRKFCLRIKNAILRSILWISYALCPPALVRSHRKLKDAFVSYRLSRRTAAPHRKCAVQGPTHLLNPRFIHLGHRFSSRPGLRIECIPYGINPPELTIGNDVQFNFNVHIGVINKVTIGNGVLVGSNVLITDHSHGRTEVNALRLPPLERPLHSRGPVVIEDNVWIGENAVILPGVTIGHGAVIGASAVVTHNVPAFGKVAGAPAKPIA